MGHKRERVFKPNTHIALYHQTITRFRFGAELKVDGSCYHNYWLLSNLSQGHVTLFCNKGKKEYSVHKVQLKNSPFLVKIIKMYHYKTIWIF